MQVRARTDKGLIRQNETSRRRAEPVVAGFRGHWPANCCVGDKPSPIHNGNEACFLATSGEVRGFFLLFSMEYSNAKI